MKNDLIYMTNTTPTSVLANQVIPLTTIARRKGCDLVGINNSVVAKSVGYYNVNVAITFNGQATGNAIISVYKNGTIVSGLTTTETIDTATTQVITTTICGVVRVYCGEQPSTLTLVNSGVAINTTNVSMVVESA